MSGSHRMQTVRMVDEDHVESLTGVTEDLQGRIVDTIRQFTSDRPLGALAIAVGLGMAIGLLVPRR